MAALANKYARNGTAAVLEVLGCLMYPEAWLVLREISQTATHRSIREWGAARLPAVSDDICRWNRVRIAPYFEFPIDTFYNYPPVRMVPP